MALFGSDSKTYYQSTSSLLYDDTPSLIKQTVMSSVTQNRNIASDLVSNIVNGVGYRADRLYDYAKNGSYPWGLPDGTMTQIAPQAMSHVHQTIEHELGEAVIMKVAYIDLDTETGDTLYKAEYYLIDEEGNAVGDPVLWEYNESTNIYPELALVSEDVHSTSPYFPIIPIYEDQQYLAAAGQPNEHAIKRACRYLNIRPDDLHDGITADPDYGSNPIEDAYIIMAVGIDDKSKEGLEYLYRFFDHQRTFSKITKTDYDYWIDQGTVGAPPINRMEIKDANYSMELGWQYITQELITGTFLVPHPTNDTLPDVPSVLGSFGSEFDFSGDVIIANSGIAYNTDVFTIRKQVSATQYIELKVMGLIHTNWTVRKETRTTLTNAFAATQDDVPQTLIIPLRIDLLRQMGIIKGHDIIFRAVRIVVNDKNEVKLKWYQTGLFRAIVIIIGIVISLYNPPAGYGFLSASAIGFTLAQMLIMNILIPAIVKELQDVVGEELALIISVIVTLYTGNYSGSSVASAGLQLASGISSIRIANALEDIQKEFEAISEDLEELEEAETDRRQGIALAVGTALGDSYAILEPENHVKRFKLMSKEPLLIRETTHQYTNMLRFTDRPDSYIRLGHTGA